MTQGWPASPRALVVGQGSLRSELSEVCATMGGMSFRFRAYPHVEQVDGLFTHASHARFVWNLACEQQSYFRVAGRLSSPPNSAARFRQLAEARADNDWLAAGSSRSLVSNSLFCCATPRNVTGGVLEWVNRNTIHPFCGLAIDIPESRSLTNGVRHQTPSVQQQALRDFDQAMRNFFSCSHRLPTWRKAGRHVGFCIRDVKVQKCSRRWARVFVPKVGWLRFRLSRALPKTGMARAADRRKDWIEKTTTELVRAHDVIVLEDLRITNMVKRPKPKPDPEQAGAFLANRAKAKGGLNRSIHRSCWGLFAQRLQDKATASGVTIIKVNPAYSSVGCRACGHTAGENRESQAEFRCVSCGHESHADTNAAQIILARGLALAPTPGHEGQDPAIAESARGNPEQSVARTTRTKAAA